MDGIEMNIRYKWGEVKVDGETVTIRNTKILINGYGRVHSSMTKEIIKVYLEHYWTKKLRGTWYLLIVKTDMFLIDTSKMELTEFSPSRLMNLMESDVYTDELPEL